jgi:hypothetical protein
VLSIVFSEPNAHEFPAPGDGPNRDWEERISIDSPLTGKSVVSIIGGHVPEAHTRESLVLNHTPAGVAVPVICRFFGIIIFMNYNDHEPPHFHARYGDQEVIVGIISGLVTGQMSKRALNMLFEWLDMHRQDLLENWNLATEHKSLKQIAPLE